jgi:hypothetical protein
MNSRSMRQTSRRYRRDSRRRAELLWTFIRGTKRRRADLRDHGGAGIDLQMYVNDEFESGQRFANRELASLAADAIRDAYQYDGGRARGAPARTFVTFVG